MPILLWLKWHVNGMLSLVNFFPTCNILLYAVWGGSHMVCRTSLALTGAFKVSVTIDLPVKAKPKVPMARTKLKESGELMINQDPMTLFYRAFNNKRPPFWTGHFT
jgi:hypothetical protein